LDLNTDPAMFYQMVRSLAVFLQLQRPAFSAAILRTYAFENSVHSAAPRAANGRSTRAEVHRTR
jgi:hypothetical protein